ncbi:MAG: (2Fe-2S)-binding protein, partial [Candidatus Stahlbacteria bacterium]|nr:(2Fe-2S)-binding protein [Candidatus Stahlbacteria bacterium]
MPSITIDGKKVDADEGRTILDVALGIGVYIPHLCAHPDLPSFDKSVTSNVIYRGATQINGNNSDAKWEGCKLCVVEVKGNGDTPSPLKTLLPRDEALRTSCSTIIEDGMVIQTNTPKIKSARQSALTNILTTHPHSCLTCAQKEGCSLTQCSTNVPQNERCCSKFGKCELQKVVEYIGLPADTPKYTYKELPVIKTDPLFYRDFNLCIGCLRCVRMCNDIRGVGALGFVFSDPTQHGTGREASNPIVGTIAPSLKESGCKFCGSCAEVCPTGAIMDKEDNSHREAPCVHNCPIGIDVPRYINYIAEHKFADALSVINEKTPFPAILGSLCEHPCEQSCRRGELNDPISICALKRFVADNRQPTTDNRQPTTDNRQP